MIIDLNPLEMAIIDEAYNFVAMTTGVHPDVAGNQDDRRCALRNDWASSRASRRAVRTMKFASTIKIVTVLVSYSSGAQVILSILSNVFSQLINQVINYHKS